MASLRARLGRLERSIGMTMAQREVARMAEEAHRSPNEVLAEALRIAVRSSRHPPPRRADGQIDLRRWYRREARANATETGLDLAEALRQADDSAAKAEA